MRLRLPLLLLPLLGLPLVIGCSDRPLPDPDHGHHDLSAPPIDMARPVDLSGPHDLSDVPDLRAPADFSGVPVDLALARDLAQPADLAPPADLALPPDLATPPACGTRFSPQGTPVASVSRDGAQEVLLGASSDGQSLLLLRAAVGTCVSWSAALTISDAASSGSLVYVNQLLGGAPFTSFLGHEATLTLGADGRTIVAVASDGHTLMTTSRSAIGATDFGSAVVGPFANIDGAYASGTYVQWPVLSPDGLAFYYQITSSTSGVATGTYEALRASTVDSFPVGTRMPDAVQAWNAVTGISSDRLTLFVTLDFGTTLMTRSSLADPFAVPATQTPPGSAYRVMPIEGCARLLGTCEPGGCQNEDICVWSATP